MNVINYMVIVQFVTCIRILLLVVQSENLLAKRTRDENTEQKIVEIFQNLVLLGKFLFKKILEDKSYNLLVIISMFIVKVVKN
ncbi:hypothetical protein RIR_jg22449.t1 [Rhizophagus irregularis DAOM 181602=DAOM 197198]|nr:hypothetical protein RIR_jg22449.t1 [Rhizophagus irregularis DAOM 181602=DAOM 197198]